MYKAVGIARKTLLFMSALVLVAGYPTSAMAISQEPATGAETTITEPKTETGSEKTEPQGGEAPETQESQASPTYTYDPITKKWNSGEWQWNDGTKSYEKPPEPIVIEPDTPTLNAQNVAPENKEAAASNSDASTTKTVDTNIALDNKVLSDALSGNASVTGNTNAGSALTGDASAVANIINAVNSSISADKNQKVATFTKDVVGDVKGDIVLYPLLLKAMLEQQALENSGTTINSTSNLSINNDVNLNAQSGNATVEGNTKAGDATTGNATAMANVINILNSMIATQDSFIGTINIYGSLEGDILVAPDFIPQMIANNGGTGDSSTKLSSQDTTTIVNNISAVAQSGAASVFGNTNGGNATSGDADSNVVIFNVTGRDIVAKNSMLVFVNVLGKWVGMIVDAHAGATAAMIGNGVTSNTNTVPDLTVESQSRHGITNTIAVNAGSGDATVRHNTTAGNATTGDAHAFANVANVSNSSLSLTGWFGLLFINITGDWLGSFGLDTAYGNAPQSIVPRPSGPVQFVPQANKLVQNTNTRRVIIDSRYVNSSPVILASAKATPQSTTSSHPAMASSQILGDTDTNTDAAEGMNGLSRVFLVTIGVIIVIGVSVIGIRRFV